jgi:hypothetical protein
MTINIDIFKSTLNIFSAFSQLHSEISLNRGREVKKRMCGCSGVYLFWSASGLEVRVTGREQHMEGEEEQMEEEEEQMEEEEEQMEEEEEQMEEEEGEEKLKKEEQEKEVRRGEEGGE